MDSSPDLSLKLRRGSSDSRDSFYMDFAQGIDSDIEEVDTTIIRAPPPPSSMTSSTQSQSQLQQSAQVPQQVDGQQLPSSSVHMPVHQTIQQSETDISTSPESTASTPPPPPPLLSQLPPLPLSPSDSESPPSILDYSERPPPQPSSLELHLPDDGSPPPPPVPCHQPQSHQQQQLPEHHRQHSISSSETEPVVVIPSHTGGHHLIDESCYEDEDDDESPPSLQTSAPKIITSGPPHISDTSSLALPIPSPTPLSLDESTVMDLPASQHHPPSPISPGNMIVSSETVSHNSSPAKSSRVHSTATQSHRVTIDDPKLPLSTSSTHHQLVTIATGPPSANSSNQHLGSTTNITASRQSGGPHLALMYHHHLHSYPVLPSIVRRPSRLPDPRYPPVREIRAGDALATTFSALYGKLIVVMGIAFPMAEVISTYIPPSFYEGFYLYLYIGSMLFLFFMYATLLWGRPKIVSTGGKSSKKHSKPSSTTSASDSMEESDTESGSCDTKHQISSHAQVSVRRPSILAPLGRQHHYGSFYLRMGAVAFGIGSMIYSGLEFGQYFELERDTKCHNVMLALTPATRMAFIFIQMYFIFLNNEQIKVYRHKILARFGLMHMIGTNLSVWLNVLIQETKHEILTFYNPENRTLRISHRLGHRIQNLEQHHSAHLRVSRGLKGPYQIFECRRTNIIGTLVQDASPFLFPCTIEYSLICAAILYVMWRSISRPSTQHPVRLESGLSPCKRSPHHYSVDCARAHKGLFIGILILVLTIISLILFFVLISRPEFVSLAVTEVTICELTIYATATVATLIGMVQIRHLQYDAARSFALDDILLVGAQTGSFLYSTFTVIGGHFTLRRDTVLVLITALASIVQTAFQTMFILDASRRQAVSPEHIRKKPGREIVTFMLVANLAMWAISTLEKSRAESHPIQLNFYGLWAWTIITHVSMPLAIFYRFHSTVCLCEIWKRAYKLKPAYM